MTRTIPLLRRRIAVIAQLISYPFIFLLTRLLHVRPGADTLLALLVLVGVSFYLYYNTGLWQFGNAPDNQLDERQVQTRNQAYRLAYIGVSVLIISIITGLLLADHLHRPLTVNYDQLSPVFWTIWTLVMVLPSAILAWTESDV